MEGREGGLFRGSWDTPDQKRWMWVWSLADLGTCSRGPESQKPGTFRDQQGPAGEDTGKVAGSFTDQVLPGHRAGPWFPDLPFLLREATSEL